MNNLNEKQNNHDLLSLLKLQRYKYNQVSKISTLNFILSVLVPIGISIIGLFNLSSTTVSYINYIGALCTGVYLWLSFKLKTMKENAAKIQYVFDVQLFGFKQNYLICNNSLTELLALSKGEKVQRLKGLENWYSIKNNLHINDAIFSCQQQNIRWDKKLRKYFLSFIIVLGLLSIFTITTIAILNNVEFNILWSYTFLLMPIVSYFISFIFSCVDDIKQQNELNESFNFYKTQKTISIKDLSSLEEKIFQYRKGLIKIPNWFFNIFRKFMQKEADDYSEVESDKYSKQ